MRDGHSNWKVVFQELLVEQYDFEVTDEDSQLFIHPKSLADVEVLQKRLQDLFLLPHLIQQQLAYNLQQADVVAANAEDASIEEIEIVRPSWDSPVSPGAAEAIEIINKVLSEFSVGSGVVLRLAEIFESAVIGDAPILLSQPLKGIALTLWENQLPDIISQLASTPLVSLRSKYLGTADETKQQITLDRLSLEKCLYLTKVEDDMRMVFDATIFHALLFPPQFILQEIEHEGETSPPVICVSKRHLITSLTQALPSGVLLSAEDEKEEAGAPSVRHPILMPSIFSHATNTIVYLMLDATGSMQTVQGDYQKQVVDFIEKLAPFFKSAADALCIIPFNEEHVSAAIGENLFLLSEPGAVEQASRFVGSSLVCGGQTRLYGAIDDVLSSATFSEHQSTNRVLVLLTDGVDNKSSVPEKENMDIQLHGIPQLKMFQSYIMGVGDEYNAEFCQDLATNAGGMHIHLKDIADFDAVTKHFHQISQARVLRNIVGQFFSVYNAPRIIPDIGLTAGEPFEIDNQKYVYRDGALCQARYLDPAATTLPDTTLFEGDVSPAAGFSLLSLAIAPARFSFGVTSSIVNALWRVSSNVARGALNYGLSFLPVRSSVALPPSSEQVLENSAPATG